jgi:hypothetical protein
MWDTHFGKDWLRSPEPGTYNSTTTGSPRYMDRLRPGELAGPERRVTLRANYNPGSNRRERAAAAAAADRYWAAHVAAAWNASFVEAEAAAAAGARSLGGGGGPHRPVPQAPEEMVWDEGDGRRSQRRQRRAGSDAGESGAAEGAAEGQSSEDYIAKTYL